jgi:hypothetical protein
VTLHILAIATKGERVENIPKEAKHIMILTYSLFYRKIKGAASPRRRGLYPVAAVAGSRCSLAKTETQPHSEKIEKTSSYRNQSMQKMTKNHYIA